MFGLQIHRASIALPLCIYLLSHLTFACIHQLSSNLFIILHFAFAVSLLAFRQFPCVLHVL
jgi:hypothetical protein